MLNSICRGLPPPAHHTPPAWGINDRLFAKATKLYHKDIIVKTFYLLIIYDTELHLTEQKIN